MTPLLLAELDAGEAAVITLALDRGIRRVAIDERRGRAIASVCGLSVVGTVGLLLRAKREGHLLALKPSVQTMRAAGVWLSDRLVAFALREAREE